jgi:hypothetical protein
MKDQYVIIDLRNMDFFKDLEGNLKYFDTEEDACTTAGFYEVENAWVMKLIYNHIENEIRPYTHEERTELLKRAMGEEAFNKAVDELMPFGGGLSEYYDSYKIPYTKN